MPDLNPMLPGLSSVSGKTVVAKFDGGRLSSDGGLLLLREAEQRLKVADRLALCLTLLWQSWFVVDHQQLMAMRALGRRRSRQLVEDRLSDGR